MKPTLTLLGLLLLAPVAALRADLDAWLKQPGDAQTLFGQPLLVGETVTNIAVGNAQKNPRPDALSPSPPDSP